MSRTRKSRARHPRPDRSIDIVTQLECAVHNPGAAAMGALIGGLVPWFGRTLAHGEIQSAWSADNHPLALAMVAVMLGCGCFSGLSVYKFGQAAFGDARKALGFVLALEGVMLVSHRVTSAVALVILVLINAIANGSVIALARDTTCRRRRADARRAVSRASQTLDSTTTRLMNKNDAPIVGIPQRPHDVNLIKVPAKWSPAKREILDAEILS